MSQEPIGSARRADAQRSGAPGADAQSANGVEANDVEDFARTGPATLAGRFMRRFWQPVYLSDDLKAGWSVPVRILSQNLTLYRGETGQAFAVAAHCAHRGALLSTGIVEDNCIRCPYHGWKFEGSGQCVEQPSEPRSFAARVRIASYPVREYLGLLFVYLGEGEPPPVPNYPVFERETGWLYQHKIHWPFNYFHHLENAIDEVHITFLHSLSPYKVINFDVPKITAEETDFGLAQHGTRSNGAMRSTYLQMPNMTSFAQHTMYPEETAWREWMSWRVPVDDHSHTTIGVTHVHVADKDRVTFRQHQKEEQEKLAQLPPALEIAAAVLSGKMRWRDMTLRAGGTDMTIIQDWITMVGQGVIPERDNENLGAADVAIRLLRKIWRRELQALKEGAPLKRWSATLPAPQSGAE